MQDIRRLTRTTFSRILNQSDTRTMHDRRLQFLRLNRSVDRTAEFQRGERLFGFPIQFREPRQQPGLGLPEAQSSHGNG